MLSVNLTTVWSCCLGSSTFALSNAKDYACIGNIVLEKRARKQAQVTLSMASLLVVGHFSGEKQFCKAGYCKRSILRAGTAASGYLNCGDSVLC